MTSVRMIKNILASMPDYRPISTPELASKMGRTGSRLRHDLVEMAELGLVEKVPIDEEGKHFSRRRVGWKKCPE